MWKLIVLLLLNGFLFRVFCQDINTTKNSSQIKNPQKNDFRTFSWGDPKEKILKEEKSELFSKKTESVYYVGKLKNSEVLIDYEFYHNQLSSGAYAVTAQFTTIEALNYYQELKENLIEKYGLLEKDDEVWSDDLFKGNSSLKEMAILSGRLKYLSSWKNERSIIKLTFYAKERKPHIYLIYYSKELLPKTIEENKATSNEL